MGGVNMLVAQGQSNTVVGTASGKYITYQRGCFLVGKETGLEIGTTGHNYNNVFLLGDFLVAKKDGDIQVGETLFGMPITKSQREFILKDPELFKRIFRYADKPPEIRQEVTFHNYGVANVGKENENIIGFRNTYWVVTYIDGDQTLCRVVPEENIEEEKTSQLEKAKDIVKVLEQHQ
jgi:hypothetical protein